MLNTVIRAFLVYALLMLFMRFMGKRQIGEMQMTEFITMLMLSELAVLPVTDNDIPLLVGIIPLAVISSAEVIISFFESRSKRFARFIGGNPVLLYGGGEYNERNLKNTRISREDVEAQIRVSGYRDESEVEKVILERTGKMSVIPREAKGRENA